MNKTENVELTVLCLITDGGRLLLQDRVKNDWKGYTLPGGHVELGESYVDACIREVKQETNLDIKNPKFLHKMKNKELESLASDIRNFIIDKVFDILDKNGYFIGGIILPGIKMQFDSLNQKTSLLPKLDIQKIDHVIGKNTKDNILSGVIRGHACAINGLIHKCESELGTKTTIILTGGLSEFIAEYIDNFDYCDKNLTLEGLKILYDLNKN